MVKMEAQLQIFSNFLTILLNDHRKILKDDTLYEKISSNLIELFMTNTEKNDAQSFHSQFISKNQENLQIIENLINNNDFFTNQSLPISKIVFICQFLPFIVDNNNRIRLQIFEKVPMVCLQAKNTNLIAGWMRALKNLVKIQMANSKSSKIEPEIKKMKLDDQHQFIFPQNFDQIPLTTIFIKRHYYQILELLDDSKRADCSLFLTSQMRKDLYAYQQEIVSKTIDQGQNSGLSPIRAILQSNHPYVTLLTTDDPKELDKTLNKICQSSNLSAQAFKTFTEFFNASCAKRKIFSLSLETIDTIMEIVHKNIGNQKEKEANQTRKEYITSQNEIIHTDLFEILTNFTDYYYKKSAYLAYLKLIDKPYFSVVEDLFVSEEDFIGKDDVVRYCLKVVEEKDESLELYNILEKLKQKFISEQKEDNLVDDGTYKYKNWLIESFEAKNRPGNSEEEKLLKVFATNLEDAMYSLVTVKDVKPCMRIRAACTDDEGDVNDEMMNFNEVDCYE